MNPVNSSGRLFRLGMAAAVCLIAAASVRADDAAKDKPAATAAVQPAKPPEPARAEAPRPLAVAQTPADPAEKELADETAKLDRLEAQLKALETAPLTSAAPPAVKAPPVKPPPDPNEIPKEPLKGLEEEYANALYAMGKYDLARAAYQRIVESKPQPDVMAWASFQAANCARNTGDLQSAGAAYETLMNASPSSPWADEAAWWAGEIKWWILWNQSTK